MGLVEVLILLLTLRSVASAREESASTNITFALPSNCPKRCGNISIEYPFGIGNGCFRPGLNLTCRSHGSNHPRLFLGDGTIEVIKFDMEKGVVYVDTPMVTMGVNVQNVSASLINLENWSYAFNLMVEDEPGSFEVLTFNILYVGGCSAIASLVDLTTNDTIDSCLTICFPNGPREYRWWPSFGKGYCTFMYDWDLANFTSLGIQLTRLNQTEVDLVNASSVKAFMYSTNHVTRQDLEGIVKGRSTEVEATLAWYISDHLTCEEARKNKKTYACLSRNSDCYDAYSNSAYKKYRVGYVCRCSISYQGNPYLSDGCQDTTFTPSLSSDCPTKCGSVNILFPFGLKEGCCRDESFALTCNETSNPPTLLLQGGYIVSNISLEEGQLEVKAVDGYYCTATDKTKPFIVLEEKTILNWIITDQSCKRAKMNRTTFACVAKHSSCEDTKTIIDGQVFLGYRCQCWEGYAGNPYLHNGCTDIDECSFPEKYICNGICTNTLGSYNCTCEPGTHGDPKREGCIPDKKRTLVLGVIIGVSNGIGILLLSTSFIILRRKWRKKKQKKIREKYFRRNHGILLQQLISSTEGTAERTKIFSLEELEKATNNFDETRVLGRGGHGTVYKGILSDQRVVAIKRSKIVRKSEIDQFINEVAILSQISHRNVVKLFGCCLETEVPLLIYEFISNGTLSDHLHDGNSSLSWEDRLRIATETAGALAYLHSSASISIFHRDVKSSNILLNDNFIAKVSDFGASRFIPLDQTHIVTTVQGTFGYLDPEYYQTSQLTEKSDVYSFGVILLELLTGKRPIFSTEHQTELNLSMHFLQAMRENCFFDLIEDRVKEEGSAEELVEIIRLIEMCLKLKGIERPTMKEVECKLQGLRRIRKLEEHRIAEVDEEIEYELSY